MRVDEAAEMFPYIDELEFMLEIEVEDADKAASAEEERSADGRTTCRDDLGVDKGDAAGEAG